MSNGLNPDQDPHSVGPDLGPNHLQKFSADYKVTASKERVETFFEEKKPSKKPPKHGNVICPDYQTSFGE